MYSQQNTSTYLTKKMFNSDKGYLKKIRSATLLNYKTSYIKKIYILKFAQRARMDLNEKFDPKPKTTNKRGPPKGSKLRIAKNYIPT